MPLQRGAGPERDDRQTLGDAGADGLGHLVRGEGEGHQVGNGEIPQALAPAMLVPQGDIGADPVAEHRLQGGQHRSNGLGAGAMGFERRVHGTASHAGSGGASIRLRGPGGNRVCVVRDRPPGFLTMTTVINSTPSSS